MDDLKRRGIVSVPLLSEWQCHLDRNQEVAVTAGPALLQTLDSSVGSVIKVQKTVNLPLNGRYFNQLLELAPGTVASTRSARFWAAAIPIWLGGSATACRFLTVNGQNGGLT